MSAIEVHQQLVEVANEFQRIERQLRSKTQQLDAMLEEGANAGAFPTDFKGVQNRRYQLEATFDPETESEQMEPQEVSFTVDRGTIFRAAYIESFVRAIGTAEDPFSGDDVVVQVTLSSYDRLNYFDYLWRLRDTGTDREWSDRPLPSLFGGGAYSGPLWFPRRNILSGGTTVFGMLQPTLASSGSLVGGFFNSGAVEKYIVQISLVGHQVPDRSEL